MNTFKDIVQGGMRIPEAANSRPAKKRPRQSILKALARSRSRGGAVRHLTLWGLAAVLVWSSTASAQILLAKTRTSASVFGGATYLVDFNGSAAGGKEFNFSTNAPNTRVVIFFNAECAVEGAPNKWVNIDIVVDPAGPTGEQTVKPSNGDNAFCSGNGTTTAGSGSFVLDGWVSAATIGTIVLPQSGNHKVKVRVRGQQAGITRLDDMSLIVMR